MNGPLQVAGRVHRGGFDLDVTLGVAAGEVLAVLGPNGAGKTTLLRTVAGLAPLTSGSIRLDGLVLDDVATDVHLPPEHRPVALVFQDYRLFPHLSVLDNVAFAPAGTGLGRVDARQRASAWLGRLDLTELTDRRPHELSGGQAQRVALARALASEPAALLMDEPLAALDTRTRLEVRTELRRYLRAFAGPVVVVTHDALEAMVLADRILVLEGGRVVQVGTPAEVAQRPRTDYVARLVGLNLYAGRLSDGDSVVSLDDGGRLVVSRNERVTDGPVLVTLRPSAITVHGEEPHGASPRNVWPGTVVDLETVGHLVRLQVQGSPPALVDVTPGAVAELDLRAGRTVWLSAKATETEAYPDGDSVPA